MLAIVLNVISLDQMILDILQSSKHKHKFPPRESIVQIKLKLAVSGNSQSGAAIKQITEAYSSSAESVFEEFTESVLGNLSRLGLNSQDRISELLGEAFTNVIVEARGCALSEFPTEEFKKLAFNHINKKSSPNLGAITAENPAEGFGFGRHYELGSDKRKSDRESRTRVRESVRAYSHGHRDSQTRRHGS